MKKVPYDKVDWPKNITNVLGREIAPDYLAIKDDRMPSVVEGRFAFNGIVLKVNRGKIRAEIGQVVEDFNDDEELDDLFNAGIESSYEPEFELTEIRVWQDQKNYTDFWNGDKTIRKRPDRICNLVIVPEPPEVQPAQSSIVFTNPWGKEHLHISEEIRQALQHRFNELIL